VQLSTRRIKQQIKPGKKKNKIKERNFEDEFPRLFHPRLRFFVWGFHSCGGRGGSNNGISVSIETAYTTIASKYGKL